MRRAEIERNSEIYRPEIDRTLFFSLTVEDQEGHG